MQLRPELDQEMQMVQLQRMFQRERVLQSNLVEAIQNGIHEYIRQTFQGDVEDARLRQYLRRIIARDEPLFHYITRYVIEEVAPKLYKLYADNPGVQEFHDELIRTLEEQMPSLLNHFFTGKSPRLSSERRLSDREQEVWEQNRDRIVALLDYHDRRTQAYDEHALERATQATEEPLTVEHIPEIRELYTRFLLTNLQIQRLATGAYSEFQEMVDKGLFLQPFDDYEEGKIQELLHVTDRLRFEKRKRRRFERESMYGTVLRDRLTKEMIAVGIHTFPPCNPILDQTFVSETEELLAQGISGGNLDYSGGQGNAEPTLRRREQYEALMRAGKVPMLFYIQGTVRHAASRVMSIQMCNAMNMKQDFGMDWPIFRTYYMHSLHLRRGESDWLSQPADAGANTASKLFLTERGYLPLALEKVTASTRSRLFRLPIDTGTEEISAFPSWEHITGKPESIAKKSKRRWRA